MKLRELTSKEHLKPEYVYIIGDSEHRVLGFLEVLRVARQPIEQFTVNNLIYLCYPPATEINQLPREVINLPCGATCVVHWLTFKAKKRKPQKPVALFSAHVKSQSMSRINKAKSCSKKRY
ncbi:hypothetical protein AWH61_19045 [Alteromonas sp. W12]|nr:hypothetical protein AWH61_19045 [Alteromonas sp. W12]